MLVVTNGRGRLFVQTLLPAAHATRLVSGDSLYLVGGQRFEPDLFTGPAPACRVEVSPSSPERTDYFLHVLTAADSSTALCPLQPALRRTKGSGLISPGGKYCSGPRLWAARFPARLPAARNSLTSS